MKHIAVVTYRIAPYGTDAAEGGGLAVRQIEGQLAFWAALAWRRPEGDGLRILWDNEIAAPEHDVAAALALQQATVPVDTGKLAHWPQGQYDLWCEWRRSQHREAVAVLADQIPRLRIVPAPV